MRRRAFGDGRLKARSRRSRPYNRPFPSTMRPRRESCTTPGASFVVSTVVPDRMPELPEVQTVVTTLRPRLLGRKIRAVTLSRTDIVTPAGFDLVTCLTGRTIRDIARRGKRIVFTLDDANRFYIHLGMTGQLTVVDPTVEMAPHTHLEIDVGAGSRLRFRDPRRFGGIWWLGNEDAQKDVGMGPEPLTL